MGYCMFVGGKLVVLKSKKQSVVAWSSTESKYCATAQKMCDWYGYITY